MNLHIIKMGTAPLKQNLAMLEESSKLSRPSEGLR